MDVLVVLITPRVTQSPYPGGVCNRKQSWVDSDHTGILAGGGSGNVRGDLPLGTPLRLAPPMARGM